MNKPIALQNQRIQKPNYAKIVINQARDKVKLPILLILLHIPLGVVLYNVGILGLLHPVIAFFIGLRHALIAEEKLEKSAQMAAYLVGSEILWRMAGIPIFWEFGQYGASLILLVALLRRRMWKIPAFPMIYFILLIPSCFVTL